MLIISPKTHSKTVKQFVDFFGAVQSEVPFWHSNFKDYHFFARVGDVPVHLLFCGYGEGTMYHAIVHAYERFLKADDTHPGVIYVGACFATSLTDVSVGDIVIPSRSHSDSEIVKSLQSKLDSASENFDPDHTKRLLEISGELGIRAFSGNIFCKETYDKDFWFPFANEWGARENYIAGEVESAACVAACQSIGVPCSGLLDVKDRIDKEGNYIVASDAQRHQAFSGILEIIKRMILSA